MILKYNENDLASKNIYAILKEHSQKVLQTNRLYSFKDEKLLDVISKKVLNYNYESKWDLDELAHVRQEPLNYNRYLYITGRYFLPDDRSIQTHSASLLTRTNEVYNLINDGDWFYDGYLFTYNKDNSISVNTNLLQTISETALISFEMNRLPKLRMPVKKVVVH